MKHWNDKLRDALAAEYALGTLQGHARSRFERMLKEDPALRTLVESWENRLIPLADAIEPVTPPRRLWRNIAARIQGRARPAGLWANLPFWRGFSAAAAMLLLAVSLYAGLWLPVKFANRDVMVVVMSDQQSRPMMTVSWPMQDAGKPKLRIRVIGHQEMAPDTSWELWMLNGQDKTPRSLGLITTHETQDVEIPPELMPAINAAYGMAMSVEPKHGSPTGKPSGPVLYSGQCTKI